MNNCAVCNRKTDAGEVIKCNGCKSNYHYKCVNITTAAFKEGQAQLKRTFKCDSCANVTRRIRVSDDTPVRGAAVASSLMESNLSFENTEAELLTSDDLLDKVGGVIMAKNSAFESNIIQEIKATVAILALENSKLRQELIEANLKCSSYEQKISSMENERLESIDNKKSHEIASNYQRPLNEPVSSPVKCASIPVASSHTISESAQVLPRPAVNSYAAVARKSAGTEVGVINIDQNDWTEVKSKRHRNPVIRGGNNSIGSLKAVERRKFLHVWRLEKSTTEQNIKEHIKQTLQLSNESDVIVEKLKPNTDRDYASFKVGVSVSNYEKLCDPEIWPMYVELSEWIWFRRSTKSDKLQTESTHTYFVSERQRSSD